MQLVDKDKRQPARIGEWGADYLSGFGDETKWLVLRARRPGLFLSNA